MAEILQKEIALQRAVEGYKYQLAACPEYSNEEAFNLIEGFRSNVHTQVFDKSKLDFFLRSTGIDASEHEILAIIRRLDIDGDNTVTFKEFIDFMKPIAGISHLHRGDTVCKGCNGMFQQLPQPVQPPYAVGPNGPQYMVSNPQFLNFPG